MSIRTLSFFMVGVILIIIVFIALFAFVFPIQKRALTEQFTACEKSYNDGKYQEAVNLLETFIKKHPRSKKASDAYYYLAMSKQKLGDNAGAMDLWGKIIKKYPKSKKIAEAHYYLGYGYENDKQYDQAEEKYTAIVKNYFDVPITAGAMLGLGRIYEMKGQESEAIASFQNVVDKYPDSEFIKEAEQRLGSINLNKFLKDNTKTYAVKKGDTLVTIARNFHTTPELIIRLSDLKSHSMNIGQTLKILDGSGLNVLIDLTKCKLFLKSGDSIIKRYYVCVGKKETPTPSGSYNVIEKMVNPTWFSDSQTGGLGEVPGGDPRNELGTRWIGFKPSFGVHGTIFSDSIGKAESHGCVRMHKEDVEELYDLVTTGTPIKIVP